MTGRSPIAAASVRAQHRVPPPPLRLAQWGQFGRVASIFLMFLIVLCGGRSSWGQQAKPVAQSTESSAAAITAYADAANLQNAGEYEVAVEEWQKFLARHPDDPLAVAAQHYIGVCLLQQKKTAEARTAFAAVIARNQPFDALEESFVNLGWCQFQLGSQGDPRELDHATQTFAEFRDKFPESKFMDQALFYGGESLYASKKQTEALALYQQLVDQFPQSPLRTDGLYALGVALQEGNEHQAAEKYFDMFLSVDPKHALAAEVRMRKGETLFARDQFDAAEKLFAEVAAVADFAAADRAIYRQAFCAIKQNRLESGAELYAQLVSRFPQSPLVTDAAMAAGRAWYRSGKLPQAKPWFTRVIEGGHADGPEAAHWLARILLKEGKPAEAAKLVESIVSKAGAEGQTAQLKLDWADALYDIPERRSEALTAYLQVAKEYSDSTVAPQATYNAAFAALELKRFDEAVALANQFQQQFSKHELRPDALHVAAEGLLLAGKHAAAQQVYAKLLAEYPEHESLGSWRVRQGLALFLAGDFPQAIATLAPTATKLPAGATRAEAFYLIGVSHSRLGQPADAVTALDASLEADAQWPDADDALLALAAAQTQLKQHDAAQSTLQRLHESFPASPLHDRLYYQRAELEFAANKFPQAIAAYQALLETTPTSNLVPAALYGKGWAELKAGNHPAAEATLTQLLERFPDHELIAKTLRTRAFCRQLQGDFRQALADINLFLAKNPTGEELLDAHYIKGLCQVGIKQFSDAVASFQTIADSGQDYARMDRTLYELGWALEGAGRKELAAARFQELVQKFPDSPLAGEAHYHVAESQYDQQQFDAAVLSYEGARAKGTKEELKEKATYKLGWAWYRQKKYDKSLLYFTEQLQQFPAGGLATDGLFMVAESQFRQDRFQEALVVYHDLLTREGLSPNASILALLHAGQSANQLKQWNEGVTFLQRLLDEHAETPYRSQAQYEWGWAKQNLNQLAEAEQAYRAVVDSSRNAVGARAQFMLGELYFANKEFPKALAEFQRLMYGYGAERAAADIKPWQAKGGLEAGRCAALLASQSTDDIQKREHLGRARKYFQHVVQQHAGTDEAQAAADQLKKIGAS